MTFGERRLAVGGELEELKRKSIGEDQYSNKGRGVIRPSLPSDGMCCFDDLLMSSKSIQC